MVDFTVEEGTTGLSADSKSQRHIQSITTGMRILRIIEQANEPVSLKEISAGVEMPSGQAHLYLVSLRMAGLIVQDEQTSRYSLGPFALQIGLSALRRLDVVAMSKEPINRIREITGETVYLAVWGNRGPTIISRLDGKRPLPMTVRVGNTLPALNSATGKIFLSYLPSSATEEVIRQECRQLKMEKAACKDAVAKIVADVTAKGFAKTETLQSFTGFAGFSAPVFNHERELAATLTVIGPENQIDMDTNGEVLRALLKGAEDLSRLLGYRSA